MGGASGGVVDCLIGETLAPAGLADLGSFFGSEGVICGVEWG